MYSGLKRVFHSVCYIVRVEATHDLKVRDGEVSILETSVMLIYSVVTINSAVCKLVPKDVGNCDILHRMYDVVSHSDQVSA